MTTNNFELTEEEYNALKGMYNSEGFGIFMRLIDDLTSSLYSKAVDAKTANDVVIKSMAEIRGLANAKTVCYNALVQNRHNYE